MKVNQLKLKKLIANREYLDNQTFKTVIGDYCKKNASYKLLDLVLKYLKNYPHQMSLISKGNLSVILILCTLISL